MTDKEIVLELPGAIVEDVARLDSDVRAFILTAVRNEIVRRNSQSLQLSLEHPHPESKEMADLGLDDWPDGLPEEDLLERIGSEAGTPVRWVSGKGWVAQEG